MSIKPLNTGFIKNKGVRQLEVNGKHTEKTNIGGSITKIANSTSTRSSGEIKPAFAGPATNSSSSLKEALKIEIPELQKQQTLTEGKNSLSARNVAVMKATIDGKNSMSDNMMDDLAKLAEKFGGHHDVAFVQTDFYATSTFGKKGLCHPLSLKWLSMQDTPQQNQFFASLDTQNGREEVMQLAIDAYSQFLTASDKNAENKPDASYGVDPEKGDNRAMSHVDYQQLSRDKPHLLEQLHQLKPPDLLKLKTLLSEAPPTQSEQFKLTKSLLGQPDQLKRLKLQLRSESLSEPEQLRLTKSLLGQPEQIKLLKLQPIKRELLKLPFEQRGQIIQSMLNHQFKGNEREYMEILHNGPLDIKTVYGDKFPVSTGKHLIELKCKEYHHNVAAYIDESKGVFKIFDPNSGEFSFNMRDEMEAAAILLANLAASTTVSFSFYSYTYFKPKPDAADK